MKGQIRAKGRCPVCEESFQQIKKLGYLCPNCKITPSRFYIDLSYKGDRIRIFSDKTGQVLDTYQRARNLLEVINYEIKNFSFDPTKYIKAELEKFWVSTLLDRFLTYKLPSIAPSYKGDYKRMVNIAKDFFNTMDIREIRKIDLINYKEHIEKKNKLNGKTVKNILDHFKTFLRYVKNDLELIDKVPSFPDVEIQQHKFRLLSHEDQVTLYEFVPD